MDNRRTIFLSRSYGVRTPQMMLYTNSCSYDAIGVRKNLLKCPGCGHGIGSAKIKRFSLEFFNKQLTLMSWLRPLASSLSSIIFPYLIVISSALVMCLNVMCRLNACVILTDKCGQGNRIRDFLLCRTKDIARNRETETHEHKTCLCLCCVKSKNCCTLSLLSFNDTSELDFKVV